MHSDYSRRYCESIRQAPLQLKMYQDANAFSYSSYLGSAFFFLIERLKTNGREVPGSSNWFEDERG
jgi:hypothetical protein